MVQLLVSTLDIHALVISSSLFLHSVKHALRAPSDSIPSIFIFCLCINWFDGKTHIMKKYAEPPPSCLANSQATVEKFSGLLVEELSKLGQEKTRPRTLEPEQASGSGNDDYLHSPYGGPSSEKGFG